MAPIIVAGRLRYWVRRDRTLFVTSLGAGKAYLLALTVTFHVPGY